MKVEAFLKCGKASCTDPSKPRQSVFIVQHLTCLCPFKVTFNRNMYKAVHLFSSLGCDYSWYWRSFFNRMKINESTNQSTKPAWPGNIGLEL